MIIAACRVYLVMSASDSVKEKRGVVKGLLTKIRSRFAVTAAEVEDSDDPTHSTIGFAVVSNSSAVANAVLDKVLAFIDKEQGDYEMLDDQTEILRPF